MPDFYIPIIEPYDYEDILAFLARHVTFGIETVKDEQYIRHFPYKDSYRSLAVARVKDTLRVSLSTEDNADYILSKVKTLFDTRHDPKSLPIKTGVRAIASFEPFEAAVSIILGQLVSIKQATLKLGQLTERFGKQLGDNAYAFPDPSDLFDKEIETIGITRSKAGAIREISKRIIDNQISFEETNIAEIERKLLSIKGIGPWTSELILMRCFGHKDAFPDNDLFIRRAIEEGLVDESQWQGKRAYLAHYLWARAVKSKTSHKLLNKF